LEDIGFGVELPERGPGAKRAEELGLGAYRKKAGELVRRQLEGGSPKKVWANSQVGDAHNAEPTKN